MIRCRLLRDHGRSFTTHRILADVIRLKTFTSFGMIGAAFGLVFIVGPASGAVIANEVEERHLLGSILTFINWLYGYFI